MFGAHDPKRGSRLPRQLALGLSGAFRQVRDIPVAEAVRLRGDRVISRAEAEKPAPPRSGSKGGRPAKYVGVPPWEKAGVSKATWHRRLKAAAEEGKG
jgi:hypothetical protein